MKNVRRVLLAGGIALAGYIGYYVAHRVMRKSSTQVSEMEAAFDRSVNFVERVKLLPQAVVPVPQLATTSPERTGMIDSALQIYTVLKAVFLHHPGPLTGREGVRFVSHWMTGLSTMCIGICVQRKWWRRAVCWGLIGYCAFRVWALVIPQQEVPRPTTKCLRVRTGYHLAPLDITVQLENDLRGVVLEHWYAALGLVPWIVGRWFCGRALALLADGRTLPQNVLKAAFGYTRTYYESVSEQVDPDEDTRMRHALGLHYPVWVLLGRPLIQREGRIMGRTMHHRVELRGFFSTNYGTMSTVSIPYRNFVACCDMFSRVSNESSVLFALTALHNQVGHTEQVDLGEESIESRVVEEYLLTTRYRRYDTVIPNFHQDQLPVVTL